MSNEGESSPAPEEAANQSESATGASNIPSVSLIIARRLRAARVAAGLTQQDLGGTQFSKSYISALERGKMVPSLQALSLLAERLMLPISYLLGEIEIDPHTLEESSALLHLHVNQANWIDQEEARLLLGQVEACIRQDQAEEAWTLLSQNSDPPEDWPILLRPHWSWLAGWTLTLLGRPRDALSCLGRGLRLAECLRLRAPHTEHARLTRLVELLHCFLGIAHCAEGEPVLALQHYHHGLEVIKQGHMSDQELKLLIYKGIGNAYFAFAQYQAAISFYKKALQQAKDTNNQRQHGLAAWGLALTYQQQGDLALAKSSYQEALECLREHGNRHLLAQIRALLGLVLVNLEEYEEAQNQLRLSLWGARQLDDTRTCGLALAYFASLHSARGEPEQAIQAALEGLPLARQSEDHRNEWHLQFTLASAYAAQHDQMATEQALQEAIRIANRTSYADLLSQAHQGYAHFLAEQQRFQEAFEELALANSARGHVQASGGPCAE